MLAGASVIASTVNVSGGTFDCEGYLTVNTSMTVSGSAALEANNPYGDITLNSAASVLNYESSMNCTLATPITGAGYLKVDTVSGVTFDSLNGNSYSGPTILHGSGTTDGDAVPSQSELDMYDDARLDLDGTNVTVSSFNGAPNAIITNSDSAATVTNATPITINSYPTSLTSTFAGTIEDGAGVVGLDLNDCIFTITSTANDFSGGTNVSGAIGPWRRRE